MAAVLNFDDDVVRAVFKQQHSQNGGAKHPHYLSKGKEWDQDDKHHEAQKLPSADFIF